MTNVGDYSAAGAFTVMQQRHPQRSTFGGL
jgi:hypothetical protein